LALVHRGKGFFIAVLASRPKALYLHFICGDEQ